MRGEGRGGKGREWEGRKWEGRDGGGKGRGGRGHGRPPKLKLGPPELFFLRRRWPCSHVTRSEKNSSRGDLVVALNTQRQPAFLNYYRQCT